MTPLAQQQQAVLALLKNRPCDVEGDAWLKRISQSKQLDLLREIARWWRQYQVAAQCRFTTQLLKSTGRFEQTVNRYFEEAPASPYIEEMARGFLTTLGEDNDPLLSEVAVTELALLEVKQGHSTLRRPGLTPPSVAWDRNPDLVFAALEAGASLPARDNAYQYQLTIGPALKCVRRPRATEPSS